MLAFFPAADFRAGAFLAGAAVLAAFAVVAGEDFLAAAFLAVELDELEDTNYLSVVVQGIFRKHRGRDKTRTCQQPHGHCGTATKAGRPPVSVVVSVVVSRTRLPSSPSWWQARWLSVAVGGRDALTSPHKEATGEGR